MLLMEKEQIIVDYPAVSEFICHIPDKIWSSCKFAQVKRGNFLFLHGDTVKYIYIICKGIIEISSDNASGSEVKVVFVTEGNIIGEMEALALENSMVYNAKTYTDCDVIKLSVEAFLGWINEDLYIAKLMASALAKKLHESSMETIKYSQHPALVRLASLLYSEECGTICKTRQQLAETCGVSVRTINRCIIRLKDKGLISTSKGKIKLLKEQKDKIGLMYYNYLNCNKDF